MNCTLILTLTKPCLVNRAQAVCLDMFAQKTGHSRVVSRSAKWGGSYLGGSSWNRPQRPNPGHLRDCWGCLGRFLGRLGHRTTAIVSTRGVGKSLEFRPGAPGDFFQVDRNARE